MIRAHKKQTYIFFHPDCTVGFGIAPNHTLRLVGFTTGRDLHPALKIVFYFYQQFLQFTLLMSDSILLTFILVKIFFRKVTLLPSLH